ncbi:aminopeptidase N [Auritidibacter ignavus]|uniref:aminopeptidase N n=2 Tax=Auritidibacter ignavus TaxID=678932 RepID=UPI001FD2B866|nr:aminopeptidase N [Auritidibacter ignavus]
MENMVDINSAAQPQIIDGIPDTTRLSRAEAQQRAEMLRVISYDVDVDVTDAENLDQPDYPVHTQIHLEVTSDQPSVTTFLDYLGASVTQVLVDGVAVPGEMLGHNRIVLTELAPGEHQVSISSRSRYSRSGEGLHRFQDPQTNQVYLYTQYEPADARRVFPTFEQPDLKARFTFHLSGPEQWVLASNQPETERTTLDRPGMVRVSFAPTAPISTYITTLLAGPYRVFTDRWQGHAETDTAPIELRIFARESLADAVDAEELFDLTRRGLDFFHHHFGFSYPWGKYDQAFVPEYNLGAMENPGLVTFTEDYVFTSSSTTAQHQARANTLLHEMSHMWFGDLVTMKWWDDLWLKESFADFMGALAVAEATEFPGSWTTFAHGRKGWAYLQDRYSTTHPIVADIADLEAARQNFDGITYAKGAAVIKQLVAFIGQDNFMAACRDYFDRFAYSNATLKDFMEVLGRTAGTDTTAWAQAWLHTSGFSTLRLHPDEHLSSVTLTQHGTDPVTGNDQLRPHTLEVGIYQSNPERATEGTTWLTRALSEPVFFDTTETTVSLQGHESQVSAPHTPRLLLANDRDLTYARLQLDPASVSAALTYPIADDLASGVTWASLWTMVRHAELPAEDFVAGVARISPQINDVGVHARMLNQAITALERFAPTGQRVQLRRRLAESLTGGLETLGDGSDRQLNAARALARLAHHLPELGGDLVVLLGSSDPVHTSGLAPGLRVDDELRWQFLIALASHGAVDQQRLDRELDQHVSAANRIHYLTARAALPEVEQQHRFVDQVLTGTDDHGTALSNHELTAIAHGVSISGQAVLDNTWDRLRDHLESIWSDRSNGLASRTITGLYPGHQDFTGSFQQATQPDQDNTSQLVDSQWLLAQSTSWLTEHRNAPAALRRVITELAEDLRCELYAQAKRWHNNRQ